MKKTRAGDYSAGGIKARFRVSRPACPTCLLCFAPPHARGLCHHHYDQARYLVREGIETWDGLVEAGLARSKLAPEHRGSVEERTREAILQVHAKGEYPSGVKINHAMGRASGFLSGEQCRVRREAFKELGIKVRKHKHHMTV